MTTVLYLLMAALVFFVIGYIWAKTGCSSGERYLSETPVDPVTADDGSCEDGETLAAQKKARETEDAKIAQATRLTEETAATEAKEIARLEAEEKARKEAEEKVVAETQAKEEAEKATKEAEAAVEAVLEEKRKPEEKKGASETESKGTDMAESAGVAPEGLLDAPIDGKKDNLTKIKGIGVKIDEALNGIGIYHFYQIAAWTEENMVWADSALAFPGRAKRDDWVGQAKLLAEGKETAFSKRVEKGEVASSKKA